MEDSKNKSLNWTDKIYHLVPDVDDMQDTFKYVENRVTLVGGSLKKFYSGLVLDIFPLSADHTTEAEPTEPEQNSASSADPVEHKANSTEPDQSCGSSADPVEHGANSTKPELDSALELGEAKEEEEEEESSLSEDNNTTECEEEVKNESGFDSLMINISEPSSTDGEMTDEKSNAGENDSSVTSTPVECSSSCFGSPAFFTDLDLEISTVFDSASPQSISESLSDVSSLCLSAFEMSRLASYSTKDTNNGEAIETRDLLLESNDSSGVERMEATSLQNDDDEEEKAKLKDSCVIVDDMALYAVSRRAQRLSSYKSKLRDIFTSKKRLAKEYEQLAIWYGVTNIELTDSRVSHPGDLDWEIL